MPEQLHPPYNIVQPRTLNRWLDINGQNGPLKRCNTYFQIPAFTSTWTWDGHSFIVIAFNFMSAHAFTITDPEIFEAIENFFVCVSYVNADKSVVRYKLNSDVGEVIFINIPAYTNQKIKKNFRIEFWCVGVADPTSEPPTESNTPSYGQIIGAGGEPMFGAGGDIMFGADSDQ